MSRMALIISALACGSMLVAGGAAAREVGHYKKLAAYVDDSFKCSEKVRVNVTAPDQSYFAGDRVDLQRMVGTVRAALGFECADIKNLLITGRIGDKQVYQGTSAAANNWALVDLRLIPHQASAQSAVQIFDQSLSSSPQASLLRQVYGSKAEKCDDGDPSACAVISSVVGGTLRNPRGAEILTKKACDLGNAASCNKLKRAADEAERRRAIPKPRTYDHSLEVLTQDPYLKDVYARQRRGSYALSELTALEGAAIAAGKRLAYSQAMNLSNCLDDTLTPEQKKIQQVGYQCANVANIYRALGSASKVTEYDDRACKQGYENRCPGYEEEQQRKAEIERARNAEMQQRAERERKAALKRSVEGPIQFCDQFRDQQSDGKHEPSEKDLCLVFGRLFSAENQHYAETISQCREGGAKTNPIIAMQCISLCGATAGACDLAYKITGFKKIDCGRAQGAPGYVCDYAISYSSNNQFMNNTMKSLVPSGMTATGRFVYQSNGWLKMHE